jgi:hypothetical protein
MTEEDEEFNRIEREASLRKAAVLVAITKKEWIGLAEDEIFSVLDKLQAIYNGPLTEDSRVIFARAIEAKLKERNT